jgi:hypothetical protein
MVVLARSVPGIPGPCTSICSAYIPQKVEALGEIQDNAFLLLYVNRHFRPLRSLLQELPQDTHETRPVSAAARALDETLFRWRRLHLGLAHRYLP